ncbi:uncharacterized protein BDZ99DRAFT_538565 [Mytilinidion resinicola]|uniref:Uncharacterized protein n=1 Tax=Mytilinidion resinicola TaxID=574789 RepID=A0A6A6YCV2_9PEZI|nr:uncharacterized protein BDZ99DRAFT_538565 [Mytilinidion resinicola]KAF2806343.1 hypothetical protein BDZ99DRAFT_538565 [Mytilinidion resinicola]
MTSVIDCLRVGWGVIILCCVTSTVGHLTAAVRKRTERSRLSHAISVIILLVYTIFVLVGFVSFIHSKDCSSGTWANIGAQQIILLFDYVCQMQVISGLSYRISTKIVRLVLPAIGLVGVILTVIFGCSSRNCVSPLIGPNSRTGLIAGQLRQVTGLK